MRFLIFTIIILVSVKYSDAQSMQVQTLQDFYREFKSSQFQQGNMMPPEIKVEGSPHENNEFVAGAVVTRSNLRYENVPLRFNIYANEMEFKTEEGNVLFIAAPEIIDHVLIGTDKYQYVPYSLANRLFRGYFKILAEGKASLLLKQNINLRDAEPPQPYKDAQPARFVKMPDEFYIRLAPAEAHRVSNRKELLQVLADKSEMIDAFIKKNKTRYNRADDLKNVVDFYNTLE